MAEQTVSRLAVPRTHNFRAVAPEALRPGQLYRSDALHHLTREGRRRLAELGLVRIIDLRSRLDRRLGGRRDRLRGVDAEHVSIPILGMGQPGASITTVNLRTVYQQILTGPDGPQVGAAIRAVAEADGPVLVHCTAGKDRTGLVVALVLTALGVDEPTVIADYSLSETNLADAWADAMVRRVGRFFTITDDLEEVLVRSPAPVLRDTLAWLTSTHGSIDAYLASVGVDDAVITRLRDHLLPP